MALLPKLIYKHSVMPIRISMAFLAEMGNLILKFTWNCKRPQRVKLSWERIPNPNHKTTRDSKLSWKKKKVLNFVGGITVSNFKTSFKATGIKTVSYWHSIDIRASGMELRVQEKTHTSTIHWFFFLSFFFLLGHTALHVGPELPIRDQTQAPCSGSAKSEPLNHQRSPAWSTDFLQEC